MIRMGIDIGGSGIKGAPVDLSTGAMLEKRLRIPTPQPAKPAAVAEVAYEQGLARVRKPRDLKAFIRKKMYQPNYETPFPSR